MSPRKHDENKLEAYLEGDSELSRLYRRDADETPDASLDARIRAEAHRAVAGRRGLVHSPFTRHWMVPASIAAVLLLSVSVVLLVPDVTLEPPFAPSGESEQAAPAARAPSALNEPVPAEALSPSAPPPASEAAGAQSFGTPRRESLDAGEADKVDEGVNQSADAPVRMRAAEPAAQRKAAGGSADTAPSPSAARRRALEDTPGASAEAARTPLPGRGEFPAQAVQADPAAWLRTIEALVDARDVVAARSNLRAFRTRYPDYPLPAGLRPLAESAPAQPP